MHRDVLDHDDRYPTQQFDGVQLQQVPGGADRGVGQRPTDALLQPGDGHHIGSQAEVGIQSPLNQHGDAVKHVTRRLWPGLAIRNTPDIGSK